jgi:hypothetical protein
MAVSQSAGRTGEGPKGTKEIEFSKCLKGKSLSHPPIGTDATESLGNQLLVYGSSVVRGLHTHERGSN